MRVSAIEVTEQGATYQLQARVASEAGLFEPFLLWYRYPAWCRPYLSAENGDPFLAALLTGAMLRGEDLALDAPVSPRTLEALPELQAIISAVLLVSGSRASTEAPCPTSCFSRVKLLLAAAAATSES